MSVIESQSVDPDHIDRVGTRLSEELKSLSSPGQYLDVLASNINVPSPDGQVQDTYWHNAADTHAAHPAAVEASLNNARRNDRLQAIVEANAAHEHLLTNLQPGSHEAREVARTADEWYRSLGTLNSLHYQGERLKQASELLLGATLRFRGVESFEALVNQDKAARSISDVLTSLDMKLDSSRDPAREHDLSTRHELISDARVKASHINSLIGQRLQEGHLSEAERQDLIAQRYRCLKITHGASFEHIQLLTQLGMQRSQRAEQTATEPVAPRFPPVMEERLAKEYPQAQTFSDRYDILVHEELCKLAEVTQDLINQGQAPNGDLFELVSYLLVARQYCTVDNADPGQYQVRFATWRQDAPMDGQRQSGKHSFDVELVNTLPSEARPSWHIPIQAKAKGLGGAEDSARQYDSGIIVYNPFGDIQAQRSSESSQASENYQIGEKLRQLLTGIRDSERDSLAYYAGSHWPTQVSDEDRRSLTVAERSLRETIERRIK